MTTQDLLAEIKARLQEAHGLRLRGVVLYGSEARGEATPESDVDVLVLLDEPIRFMRDVDTNLLALYPLSSRIGRRISPKPVSVRQYATLDCPLFQAAHREGIAA